MNEVESRLNAVAESYMGHEGLSVERKRFSQDGEFLDLDCQFFDRKVTFTQFLVEPALLAQVWMQGEERPEWWRFERSQWVRLE